VLLKPVYMAGILFFLRTFTAVSLKSIRTSAQIFYDFQEQIISEISFFLCKMKIVAKPYPGYLLLLRLNVVTVFMAPSARPQTGVQDDDITFDGIREPLLDLGLCSSLRDEVYILQLA
jgi:hypothetical protein